MIDPKYLDMLKKQPSVNEMVDKYLLDTIDRLVTCAICDVTNQPLPKEYEFKKINLGQHRTTGRKLIMGELDDEKGIHVEFSPDYKKAYVAKHRYGGYEEVELPSSTAEAVEQVFDTIDQKIKQASRRALPSDPVAAALLEFLSETRYGDNEYLCNEFKEIYRRKVDEMSSDMPEEVRETVRDALYNLTITDIRQFLSENGIDTADVHIIGE